jgi:glycosyltransferase involved in cell wall biosynthesis
VPYRSHNHEHHHKAQLGVGWSFWNSPSLLTERVLDGIPGFLVWFAFAFSILCAAFFPYTMLLLATLLAIYTATRFLFAGYANRLGLKKIRDWEKTDWRNYYQTHRNTNSLEWDDVQHVVIIPNYNEPLEVLRRTLDNLKNQCEADSRMTIVLAMEAGEDGCVAKAETLQAEYAAYFKHFHFTVHPRGLPGEMQCKSANEAWAARWVKRKLVDDLDYSIDHILVTTMDADTRWHPQHFFALTALFALNENRHRRFWQAPIRYHGNIWDINPLLRIINAYATAFELAYLASPWWLAMPMSSYTLSLKLLHDSNYWDGDVIADEWHMFIKAYFARGGSVDVEPVMLPFIADATVGDNLIGELREKYLQTLRHAWGSKEIGYMMGKMLDHPEVPLRQSARRLFRISHDILLAGAGWMILTVGAQLPVLLHPEIAPFNLLDIAANPSQSLSIIGAGLLANPIWLLLVSASLLVILLAILFWFQDVQVRPPRTRPQTMTERFWTLLSFPLMPVITLIVLAIPAIQAQTRLLMGQPLQFRVSKKIQ